MKKYIGNTLALYPTPLVVVGAMVDDKPNWLLVGHLGIIGHDHVMVSLASAHFTNKGIKETKLLSINIVDEEDKSQLFDYEIGAAGAPIIKQSPVVMECSVEDIYETKGFETFICTISNTYADENVLTTDGKIDYHILKPVLFEMPTYEYFKTGEALGKCMTIGKVL